MWKIFIILFGVLFGIFIPKSIYENYTDTNREDSTYEEYSYADSEDSVMGTIRIQIRSMLPDEVNLKTYNNKDYDPTKTDWENYGDTGSIMEIADTGLGIRKCSRVSCRNKGTTGWCCVLCQCS